MAGRGGLCPVELVEDRQREALLVECRARKIEPPGRTRVEKVLVAARGKWEKTFCARTIGLGEAGTAWLLSLVAEDDEAGTALLAALKRDPGAVGLDSLLTEITKLNDVRKLGLPDGLFADCSEKLVGAWRARAIKMYPSDFRDTAEDVRITLLAALCSSQAEITDALVDRLVTLVHKINARAERRVEKQLTAELKKVRGKEGSSSSWRRLPSTSPTRSYAGLCSRWSGRRRCASWWPRRRRTRRPSRPRSAPRSGRRTARTTGRCCAAAEHPGLQVQQHRLPAGDGRDEAAEEVRRRRRQDPFLRRRR